MVPVVACGFKETGSPDCWLGSERLSSFPWSSQAFFFLYEGLHSQLTTMISTIFRTMMGIKWNIILLFDCSENVLTIAIYFCFVKFQTGSPVFFTGKLDSVAARSSGIPRVNPLDIFALCIYSIAIGEARSGIAVAILIQLSNNQILQYGRGDFCVNEITPNYNATP